MEYDSDYRAELERQVLDLVEEHLEQVVELDTPLRDICDELDMLSRWRSPRWMRKRSRLLLILSSSFRLVRTNRSNPVR